MKRMALNPPPISAPTPTATGRQKPPTALRVLSGVFAVLLAIPAPIVGLFGLAMTFYLIGFSTSEGSSYVGGSGGVFIYFACIGTPILAVIHVISAFGAVSSRFIPALWIATVLHTAVCWAAIYFVARDGHSPADSEGRSWTPLLLAGIAPTSVAIFGFAVSLFTRKSRSDAGPENDIGEQAADAKPDNVAR